MDIGDNSELSGDRAKEVNQIMDVKAID